jgi:mRNA interferase MazF
MTDRNPATGDIWLARLDPIEGFEQGGTRPVLVVSGARYNRLQPKLRIVVSLTTRDRELPFHIRIDPPEGGVRSASFAITEQPRTISTTRLLAYWGTVSQPVRDDVLLWITDFLNEE